MERVHFEPYLFLADVTHESALIAWGGFYFGVNEGFHRIVDDQDLDDIGLKRVETIGARSEPFGKGHVELRDKTGKVVASAETTKRNHVWIEGLSPDSEYTYEVTIDGKPWAAGDRLDWDAARQGLYTGSRYACRLRTHPHPEQSVPLRFVIQGDFGVGIRRMNADGLRQQRLAKALARVVESAGARLMLTTGDNIYLSAEGGIYGSGDEDDDWFFTFYQPYRYVIDRIPLYPSVGNHDTGDTELTDDRAQLEDNFFFDERFRNPARGHTSSVDPGLFYRVRYGSDIEFLCIDTSSAKELEAEHFFEDPRHRKFVTDCLQPTGRACPKWRIPFGHHPPYCAGPTHSNSDPLLEHIVPILEQSGVRLMFSGHEHNFQYSSKGGVHYFVSGAGGKLNEKPPVRFDAAHTRAWSSHGHFLLVTLEGAEARVTPIGADDLGNPRPIELFAPDGSRLEGPIKVSL